MSGNDTTPRSKVARLIEDYALDGIGSELEHKWTRSTDRVSLRDLAAEFNERLVRSALADTSPVLLDGEPENLYRLLTDDNVTRGVRMQAKAKIERRGVDADALEDDFVTYQAMRTYLRSYRDAELPEAEDNSGPTRGSKQGVIERLTRRLEQVTERSLEELQRSGAIALGSFYVVVDVRVHCTDCSREFPISQLLANGECGCER